MMKYLLKTGLVAVAVFGFTACDAGNTGSDSTVTHHSQAELSQSSKPQVVMYKPPTCDCCSGWAEHLRREGFTVVVHKSEDMEAIKVKYGVTRKLASCHTAIVDGYVIEGHVPAADVERLLKERPADVVGLTAPGMPQKAPGMQAVGLPPKGYNILAFDKNGDATVYHRY